MIRFLDGGLGLVQPVYQGVERLQERLNQRGLIAIGRLEVGLGRRLRNRIDNVEIEIAGHFFHNFRGHRIALIHEGTDQGMFAQQIGDSGDSAGVPVHGSNRFRAENFGIFRAGDAQAFLDVALRFIEGELSRLRAQRAG